MFCRSCRYNLAGLIDPRCPECGRGFDPDDPGTYRLSAGFRITRRHVAIVLIVLLMAGGAALWHYGPRRTVTSSCVYCGASRTESWRLGIKVRDTKLTSPVSQWVGGIVGPHACTQWRMSSRTWSGWGRGLVGCGVGSAPIQIYYAGVEVQDMPWARRTLGEYHTRLLADAGDAEVWAFGEVMQRVVATRNGNSTP